MPRLFVATYLSPEGVQRVQELARGNELPGDANKPLSEKWNARVRWVTADKLHLTWLFLGDVVEELVGELTDALGESVAYLASRSHPGSLGGSPGSLNSMAELVYDHFELWPSPRKARLGVIVPSSVPENIVELAQSISNNLSRFLTPEQREATRRQFKPHLTVMRLSPSTRKGGAHSGQFKPRISMDGIIVPPRVFPIHQSIDRVELIESDMGKKVQGYVTRASFDVRTSRAD